MEKDCANAFQVFVFGLGGVFICLLILTAAIKTSGAIIHKLIGKKKV